MKKNTNIHSSAKIFGTSSIGDNSVVLENVVLGYPEHSILTDLLEKGMRTEEAEYTGCTIGSNSFIRPNTTIFSNVRTGDNFRTGHNCMVRENTTIGDNVLIGTNVIIDGNVTIGDNVSIQGNVYIPTHVKIEDNVFIGPCAVLTNDKYPIRNEYHPEGPIIRKGASIGANATILPGVEIGEGAMVAGGALVTKNVPAWKLAIGCPAEIKELNEELQTLNKI